LEIAPTAENEDSKELNPRKNLEGGGALEESG